jgi:hypothetical protein
MWTSQHDSSTPNSVFYCCHPLLLFVTTTNSVGFEVFTAVVMKSIIFWDVTPCSLLRFNRRFRGTYRLHLQGRRKDFQQVSRCLMKFFSSILNTEAICSSETSVASQQTTRRHIPEDDTLHYQLCLLTYVTATRQELVYNIGPRRIVMWDFYY